MRCLLQSAIVIAALSLLAGCPKQELPPPPAAPDTSSAIADASLQPPAVVVDASAGSESDASAESPAAPPVQQQERPRAPIGKDPSKMTFEEKAEEARKQRMRGDASRRFRPGMPVEFEFTGATPDGRPGSPAKLGFRFEARKSGDAATMELLHTDKDPARGKLMLDGAGVEVLPQLSDPHEQPLGSERMLLRFLGRYIIYVKDANGKNLAAVVVDHDGDLQQGDDVAGYMTRAQRDPDTHELRRISIRKRDSDKLGAEVLQLRWNNSGFTERNCEDTDRNRFEYRFPAGWLELIPPDEAED